MLVIKGIAISCLVLATLFTAMSLAMQIELSEEDMLLRAEKVVVGTVIEKLCYWDEDNSIILTDYTISVVSVVKGSCVGDELTVTTAGGEVGEVGLFVPDQPHFIIGEKVLLHLERNTNGVLKTIAGVQGSLIISNGMIATTGEPLDSYLARARTYIAEQSKGDE